MTGNRWSKVVMFVCCLVFTGCNHKDKSSGERFDQLTRVVEIGNWKYSLHIENQSEKPGMRGNALKDHYLKATLYISNSKTQKSLLYSSSKDGADYEAKYRYLSFNSKDDFYIRCGDEVVYPIGYVFEPSNGLSSSERLVYKFQIGEDLYSRLRQHNLSVEYWYIDRLVGLGKICFTQQ